MGYYTLPILFGDRLVARLDPKLDRTTSTLLINGFWFEELALAENSAFTAALARGLIRFAEFLGIHRLNIVALEPSILRRQVQANIGKTLEQVGI